MARKPVTTVATVPETIARIVNAIAASKDATKSAHDAYTAALGNTAATLLTSVMAIMHGVKPITLEAWKADWAGAFQTALRASQDANGKPRYNSDASISVMLSNYKTVCIALSYGIAPTETTKNLETYGDYARPLIPEAAGWTMQKAREPKVAVTSGEPNKVAAKKSTTAAPTAAPTAATETTTYTGLQTELAKLTPGKLCDTIGTQAVARALFSGCGRMPTDEQLSIFVKAIRAQGEMMLKQAALLVG